MNYDIIGDIHGHAAQLELLLRKLGYQHRAGAWRHPDRMAIFVGDLIDRGPAQLPTLQLVRAMTDAGSARVAMGNHEFNAIAWATSDPANPGHHFRSRLGPKGERNRQQHWAFLEKVGEDTQEHRDWVSWLFELPLWIEEPSFRVVHACWSPAHASALEPYLRSGARMTPQLLEYASRKGTAVYDAIEILLKGVEVRLPPGVCFKDKEGYRRSTMRTRWWNANLTTYRAAYIGPPGAVIPDVPIANPTSIPEPDRPTFIGHYWLEPDGPLEPVSKRVACVDYSVANNGPLVAYRFDGETELSADKFVAAWP